MKIARFLTLAHCDAGQISRLGAVAVFAFFGSHFPGALDAAVVELSDIRSQYFQPSKAVTWANPSDTFGLSRAQVYSVCPEGETCGRGILETEGGRFLSLEGWRLASRSEVQDMLVEVAEFSTLERLRHTATFGRTTRDWRSDLTDPVFAKFATVAFPETEVGRVAAPAPLPSFTCADSGIGFVEGPFGIPLPVPFTNPEPCYSIQTTGFGGLADGRGLGASELFWYGALDREIRAEPSCQGTIPEDPIACAAWAAQLELSVFDEIGAFSPDLMSLREGSRPGFFLYKSTGEPPIAIPDGPTPVPVPMSALLLFSGLLAMPLLRSRRG